MERLSCYNCFRKHIGQAKVLWDEMRMGYPQHYEFVFAHMAEAEEEVWKVWDKWQDSLAQMAEASDEILKFHEDLANEVREHRVQFESDPNYKPPFNELRRKSQVMEERSIPCQET